MSNESCQPGEPTRREFLRGCSLFAAAALAVGAVPVEALPVRWISGSGVGGTVSYPIPAADGVEVDRNNSILLTRYQQHVYAFSMICPHQRAAVKWLEHDGIFQCSKHKSKYDPSGGYLSGRATRSLDRHPLHVAGGMVIVDTSVLLKEDADAAAWAAAVAQV